MDFKRYMISTKSLLPLKQLMTIIKTKLTGGKIAFTNDYRIIKEKMQIDKRNTLQKVRIRGQDKLPHHNGDCKNKVIDKNNEKCYFVEVVIQFVHSRVTTEEIENRICDLNNVGC